MANPASYNASCLPTADGSFGPVIHGHNCRSFDFTLAFEQYFFSIAPASILILAAPLRLRQLSGSPRIVGGGSVLRRAKLGAAAVFAAFQLSLVAAWAAAPASLGRVRTVSLAAACVSLVASLLVGGLSHAEHARSPRPSPLLNAYLLASLLLDAATARSYWLSAALAGSPLLRALFTASVGLKAALVVLEAVEKRGFVAGRRGVRSSPEATSGLYGRALLWWMVPLLRDGFRRLLRPDDLYSLDESMSAAVLHEAFWKAWDTVNPATKNRLILACLKTLKWPLLGAVVPRVFLLFFTICQSLVLGRFLAFLQDPEESTSIGYGLIGAYGLVYIGIAVSTAFYSHKNTRTLAMLRGTLISAIFSRSTALSAADVDSAAVTLMSTDVDAIIRAWRELHELWATLIQVSVATWLLSTHIGYACVGPLIVCALGLAVCIVVGPSSKRFMVAWTSKVQQRIGTISTMLGYMRSIKMSGLGPKLGTSIAQLRRDEIDTAAPFRMTSAFMSAVAQVPNLLSPVAAFAFFTLRSETSGVSLGITRMFTSLSLILLLSQPLFWVFKAILDVFAALGCFKRIQDFLCKTSKPEGEIAIPTNRGSPDSLGLETDASITRRSFQEHGLELQELRPTTYRRPDKVDAAIHNATFSWAVDSPPLLKISNMEVENGHLAIVIGPVASGKTTLLKGLLGEVPSVTGHVELRYQKVAWCEQTPWLINDTVLMNIVGYAEYDEKLYRSVIHACDLDKDLWSLASGDQTVIGSKGAALSGGQKQRVALARALYSRPQLALFDDPLSSLDNHTAETVFNRVFGKNTGILRQWGTTIILVTQAVKFLPDANKIIVLNEGSIAEQGTFDTLVKAGGYVESLCSQSSAPDDQIRHSNGGDVLLDQSEDGSKTNATPTVPASPTDKRRQRGDFAVYSYFFNALGLHSFAALLVCEISWAFLTGFPTVWLNWWADANVQEPNQRVGYYLGVYAALQVLAVISFGALILVGIYFVAARVGFTLHQKLLDVVIRAPLSLFTTTDIGSITTRFSQDIGLVDTQLPLALLICIADFFIAISQAVLLASSTGYVAVTFPFLIALFFYIQRGYLRTSRQLRFLDLEEKAPVYTQFLETLSGLVTIRAFGWTAPALERNHSLVDKALRPFYLLQMVQQWLELVLNLITAALAIVVVGLAVKLRGSVSAGLTGVSLVQLITLAETFKMLIQFWTSLETSIGAVARIKNFGEETPDERLPGENQQPPEDWPARGQIEIRDVSVSYGDDLERKALDTIDLKIEARQKVGVVGRTGSGKSTLLLALLRLVPNSTGTISIDGVDISTLARDTVRERIVTVSQDTFSLPGTVRRNIDPHGGASAAAAEAVLRRVGLWDVIAEGRGGLEAPFDDGLLSHGQRQLFSLARAVLRTDAAGGGRRVVVFDEATSSVDAHTDATIRRFLRDEFRDHTVVWVAHRLETVMGFDRVVVLERGCVVEDGNPRELVAAGGNRFSELWSARHREGSPR